MADLSEIRNLAAAVSGNPSPNYLGDRVGAPTTKGVSGDYSTDKANNGAYICQGGATWAPLITSTGDLTLATNTIALGTAAVAGTAGTTLRSDDTILAFDATAPTTSAVGDAAAAGAATTTARRDHVHGREAFATNTIALGTAAAAGAATTLVRSDATILAFDATSPAASVPSDTAVVGAATTAARRDHRHAREAKQVLQTGITSATGDINNTETLLATLAGLVGGTTLAAGSKIRITAEGTCTASGANVPTFTIRAGTLGTTSDASVAAIALAASAVTGTAIPFSVTINATVRTLGGSGTLAGSLTLINGGAANITGISTQVVQVVPFTSSTLATTTATNIDITFVTAGATTTATFQDVTIEVIP